MKHQISLFDDTDSPGWVTVWIMSIVLSVIGLVFLGGALGWALAPLALLPGALLSYGIFGHVLFSESESSAIQKGWMRYKALPTADKRIIAMDAKGFVAMTSAQRHEFTNKIDQLETIRAQRENAMTLNSDLRARLDSIIENEKSALEHEKTVKAELTERGWE